VIVNNCFQGWLLTLLTWLEEEAAGLLLSPVQSGVELGRYRFSKVGIGFSKYRDFGFFRTNLPLLIE